MDQARVSGPISRVMDAALAAVMADVCASNVLRCSQ